MNVCVADVANMMHPPAPRAARTAALNSSAVPKAAPPLGRQRASASFAISSDSPAAAVISRSSARESWSAPAKALDISPNSAAQPSSRAARQREHLAGPGRTIEATCERLDYVNRGVCFEEGSQEPVLIENAVPGERVRAKVIQVRCAYLHALRPSPLQASLLLFP